MTLPTDLRMTWADFDDRGPPVKFKTVAHDSVLWQMLDHTYLWNP